MSLKEKVVKGIAWSTIQNWGAQAINLIVFLVLARLLDPEAFGLMALASIVVAFAQIVVVAGLVEAVVQRRDLSVEHLNAAFWANILMGSLLTLNGILLSRPIAGFFGEPDLAPIIVWISFSFILIALSSTQKAILQRRLDFKSLAVRTLLATLSGGIVGVSMALLGFGVWSLVAQNLAGAFVGVLVLWGVSDWRPDFSFSIIHFKELVTFSSSIMGTRILGFFDTRLDDILIGYFLGATALGYYTVAYRFLRVLLNLLSNVTTAVTFATFARLQQDTERLRNAFYQVVQLTSVIAFPVFIGCVVIAPEFVLAVFGEKWISSITVMQVLSLSGLFQVILNLKGNLIKALGRPNWLLVIKSLATLGRVIAFLYFVQWGIIAMAGVVTFSMFLLLLPYTWLVNRLIPLDLKTYVEQYLPSLISSLVMMILILLLKRTSIEFVGLYLQLFFYIIIGGGIYIVTLWLLEPTSLYQLLKLLQMIFPQWPKVKIKKP